MAGVLGVRGKGTCLALIFVLCLVVPAMAGPGREWAVTAFGAIQLRGDMGQSFYAPDFNGDIRFLSLSLSRRFYSLNRHLDLELEGQVVKHVGGQYHEEFNALLVARWRTFPWNHLLPTTFAFGEGLSYATEVPDWETTLHGRATQWLNYLLFELTFSHPSRPRWSLVWRLHHRSGVFRFFENIEGASNAMGLGIRYRF